MNLYLFSIGGSGVRVLHSLTMLLAAGMEMKADKVVPIIIDTDFNNGNAKRTIKDDNCLIKNYTKIKGEVDKTTSETTYKKHKIKKTSIFTTNIEEPVMITIDGSTMGKLKDVIDVDNNMEDALKDKVNTLFTSSNLEMPLECGFVGNPSIGSVVLNYILSNDVAFQNVVKRIGIDDKIFIISSIFGGTGASGYPLLLNIFNNSIDTELNKKDNVIGALSLTPYYNIDKSKSKETENAELNVKLDGTAKYIVDSNLFNTKTFAAQVYYEKFISSEIDVIYYCGDEDKKSYYPSCLGGVNQCNESHIVELLGALTILDFCNEFIPSPKTKGKTTTYYSNQIFKGASNSIPSILRTSELHRALARLWMFKRFYEEGGYLKENYIKNNYSFIVTLGYTDNEDIKELQYFLNDFTLWAKELNNEAGRGNVHGRTFQFVSINEKPKDSEIHSFFDYLEPSKNRKGEVCNSEFLSMMNTIAKDNKSCDGTIKSKLIRLSTQVIDYIINDKDKIKQ